MKNISLILLALVTLVPMSFARSIDTTPVLATLDISNYGSNVYGAALLDDQRLQVHVGDQIVTKILTPMTFQVLKNQMSRLSRAELTTRHNPVICMTFAPVPGTTLKIAEYNEETDFTGRKLRTVLTPQGCYMRTMVAPTNAQDRREAEALSAELKILAFDAAQI